MGMAAMGGGVPMVGGASAHGRLIAHAGRIAHGAGAHASATLEQVCLLSQSSEKTRPHHIIARVRLIEQVWCRTSRHIARRFDSRPPPRAARGGTRPLAASRPSRLPIRRRGLLADAADVPGDTRAPRNDRGTRPTNPPTADARRPKPNHRVHGCTQDDFPSRHIHIALPSIRWRVMLRYASAGRLPDAVRRAAALVRPAPLAGAAPLHGRRSLGAASHDRDRAGRRRAARVRRDPGASSSQEPSLKSSVEPSSRTSR